LTFFCYYYYYYHEHGIAIGVVVWKYGLPWSFCSFCGFWKYILCIVHVSKGDFESVWGLVARLGSVDVQLGCLLDSAVVETLLTTVSF